MSQAVAGLVLGKLVLLGSWTDAQTSLIGYERVNRTGQVRIVLTGEAP